MGNSLIWKWEENNHGLDHKCGTCNTVLSNPRAKKTCLGVHEEVCPRYHGTLFFVGSSHKCDACRKTIELHDKRHREMANLIQRIQKLDIDATYDLSSPLSHKKERNRGIKSLEEPKKLEDTAPDDHGESREESTICDGEPELERHLIPNAKDDRVKRKARKAEKKMSQKQTMVITIAPQLMSKIDETLHPPDGLLTAELGHTYKDNNDVLMSNDIIEANINFNRHLSGNWRPRQSIHTKKLTKAQPALSSEDKSLMIALDDAEITHMLAKLEITPEILGGSRERKSLVAKLKESIRNDLVIVDNESRQEMKRMAGYWRWANRRTYNHMVRNNELWDWTTGQKLEEIEEDEGQTEVDYTERVDTVLTNNGLKSLGIESYDDDFELHKGVMGLSLVLCTRDDEDVAFPKLFDGVKDIRHLKIQVEREKPLKGPLAPLSPNITIPKTPRSRFSGTKRNLEDFTEMSIHQLEGHTEPGVGKKYGIEKKSGIKPKTLSKAEIDKVYNEVLEQEALALSNSSKGTFQKTVEPAKYDSSAPQHQNNLPFTDNSPHENQLETRTTPRQLQSILKEKETENRDTKSDSDSDSGSDPDFFFNPGAFSKNPYALLAPPPSLPAKSMKKGKKTTLRIKASGSPNPAAKEGDFTPIRGKGKGRRARVEILRLG